MNIGKDVDSPNYNKANEFARKNGYTLSNDVSYNGYIFFTKEILNGEHKLELQVFSEEYVKNKQEHYKKHFPDLIQYAGNPEFMLYNKEANFGGIMDETTYSFKMHYDHSQFGVANLDELFALALQVEKELEGETEAKILKEYLASV